jgi:hypothetical protein
MQNGVVRYFTGAKLVEAARRADEWNFNRQLDLAEVSKLPEEKFPIVGTFSHHRRAGEPCELHIRCWVDVGDDCQRAVDVPWEWYKALPTMRVLHVTTS